MRAAARRRHCAAAGAAVLAAGGAATVVAASVPAAPAALTRSVQLSADGDSILNIPVNLFQQLVNIPATEVQALNVLAGSLFFTGPWLTASATNLWGEDPGDPGHFMALVDLLIPFQTISGLGAPELDPVTAAAGTAGLGQQLALWAAAELPADASCAADWCAPLHPTTPITGSAPIDQAIWIWAIESGLQRFPLTDNWFQVPLADLQHGYTFGDVPLPSPGIGPGGAVPGDAVFGFPGTSTGPDGENLMPWSGITFTFNPLGPLQTFYQSLLAPPDAAGFEFPGLVETGRALQSVAAGLAIDFNPFVPGSGTCPGQCDVPAFLTPAGLVKGIDALWPGNPMIGHWLALNADGAANWPTQHQIDWGIAFVQGGQTMFDLGNPPPSQVPDWVDNPAPFEVGPLVTELIQLAKDSGVQSFVQMLADVAGFEPYF